MSQHTKKDERVRAAWATSTPLLTDYYDTEWGMPVFDEAGVFERLTLEAFQSGLSWLTILRKRDAFRQAFANFDIEQVAAFEESDIQRLLNDSGIIRNRAKITATTSNARAILDLHEQHVTLSNLVWAFMPQRSPQPHRDAEVPVSSPESAQLAATLKRQGVRFIGPTTAYALMAAIGIVDAHLTTSHRRGCSGLWDATGTRSEAGQRLALSSREAAAAVLGDCLGAPAGQQAGAPRP